jgi:hypothetical protein
MRGRLKVILPGVNVAVAAVLLGVGYTRPLWEWVPVPWEIALAYAINVPANLLRNLVDFLWDKHVHPLCSVAYAETCISFERKIEIAIFLVGVGLVWYIVGLEIESIGLDKRALVPSSTPFRVGADALLLLTAGLLAFIVVANWRSREEVFAPLTVLNFSCYLAWTLAIGIAYGRDLFRCVARSR